MNLHLHLHHIRLQFILILLHDNPDTLLRHRRGHRCQSRRRSTKPRDLPKKTVQPYQVNEEAPEEVKEEAPKLCIAEICFEFVRFWMQVSK